MRLDVTNTDRHPSGLNQTNPMMQPRALLTGFTALALAATSACSKKESTPAEEPAKPSAEATPSTETGTTPEVTPAPAPKPAITTAEVAKLLGHAADLPKDFATATIVDAGQIKKHLKDTAIWKDSQEMMGGTTETAHKNTAEEESGEPNDANAEEVPVVASAAPDQTFDILTSGRIVVATGPDTAPRTLALLQFISAIQEASMEQTLTDLAEEYGLLEAPADMDGNPFAMMAKLDFDRLIKTLENLAPPMLYVAFDAAGQEDKLKEMVAGMEAMTANQLPPFVKREPLEIGGASFQTLSVKAEEVVSLQQIQESLAGQLPDATIQKLYAAIAQKTLCIGFGMRQGNFVFFMAADKESLKFAASPEESLAAREEFAFLAPYKDKNPFLVSMASKEVNTSLRTGGNNAYLFDVARKVLGQVKALGDLSDVLALLEKSSTTMRALSQGTDSGFCSAGYFENGVRIESLGGSDLKSLDGTQPLAFAQAIDNPDNILMLNMRADAVAQTKSLDLLEDLAEITYELGQRYAASDAGKESGMSEPFMLFRDKMLPHVTTLWRAQREQITGGLGMESALVMDMGATLPKFPGLPEALAAARIPRIVSIYPVTDRAKLGEGWKAMEPALKGLLAALPVPEDKKVTLPDPFTSEKEGFKTYFYGFSGITNDDFMPAASISDKLFMLSSSKNFAESLATKIQTQPVGPNAPSGLVFNVKFEPIVSNGTQWLDLLKTNATTVFTDELSRSEFLSNEPEMRKALGWLKPLKSFELHMKPEGNLWRTSIHLNTAPK